MTDVTFIKDEATGETVSVTIPVADYQRLLDDALTLQKIASYEQQLNTLDQATAPGAATRQALLEHHARSLLRDQHIIARTTSGHALVKDPSSGTIFAVISLDAWTEAERIIANQALFDGLLRDLAPLNDQERLWAINAVIAKFYTPPPEEPPTVLSA